MNNQAPAFVFEIPAYTGDDAVVVRFVLPDGSVHTAKTAELVQEYSDMYKEMHGIRPRWLRLDSTNVGREFENLCFQYEQHCKEEKVREQQSIAEFEAAVSNAIARGAGNRKTAIRWLLDAVGCSNDLQYGCYHYDLPYGYFDRK